VVYLRQLADSSVQNSGVIGTPWQRWLSEYARVALIWILIIPLQVSSAERDIRKFSIGVQDLTRALIDFSEQSGLVFIAPSDLVAGKQAAAVEGMMSSAEALSKMLEGTGLAGEIDDQGILVIKPDAVFERQTKGNTMTREQRKSYLASVFSTIVAVATGAVTALVTPTVSAQQGGAQARGQVLEEVVVTARKREESLQDVPIAITVLDGDLLNDRNVSDLTEMATLVPSFHYNEGVNQSDVFVVRGLGTFASRQTIEQTIGIVFDGHFLGRSQFGRSIFLDLERFEVLKGPQGALIGKNNSAGAINITARKPGNEPEGYIQAGYDFLDADGFAGEAAYSLPLSDTVRTRFALRYEDKDGWVNNTGLDPDATASESITIRNITQWDITDKLSAETLIQWGDIDRSGRNRESFNCTGDANSASPRAPGDDCIFNARTARSFIVDGEPAELDTDTEFYITGLTLNYSFEKFDIAYLFNYSKYNSNSIIDSDQTFLEMTHIWVKDDWDQHGHELRFATTGDNIIDFTGGLYYAEQESDLFSSVMICRVMGGLGCTDREVVRANGFQRHGFGVHETETFAVFGQFDWHITEQWTISAGGRWTDEDKSILNNTAILQANTFDVSPASLINCTNVPNEGLGVEEPGGAFKSVPCPGFVRGGSSSVQFSRNESDFNPNASLRWRVEDHMLYFSFAEGFKGGGFTFPVTTFTPAEWETLGSSIIEFDSEETTNYEFGGKHVFLNGTLLFNWAAWYTEFEDAQVAALEPVSLTVQLVNAAEASSKGVEADFLLSAHENMTLYGAVAYTDAEFDRFPAAPCFSGQVVTGTGCDVFVDGRGPFQNLNGHVLPYAPEWQFNFGARGSMPVGNGYQVGYNLFYRWVDDQFFEIAFDPLSTQESYGKFDATLSFGPANGSWKVSLIGKNLNDKLTAHNGNTSTLAGQIGDQTFPAPGDLPRFKMPDVGRQLAVQVRMNFD